MSENNPFVNIRAAEPNDADTIYAWENNTEIWRVSETYTPYSLFQIEQFLMNNNDLFSMKQLRLMIDNKDGTSIGCIDIYDYDPVNSRVGIGILIQKKYRKQGYALSALKKIINYCFNILILKQLYILTSIDNIDSINLFETLGFKKCGHRKEWIKTPEGFIDEIEYQYINKNYK